MQQEVVEGTLPRQHATGVNSKKYELNGISLTGINTDHNLPNNLTLKNASDIDKYYLEIDRGTQNGNVANSMTQGEDYYQRLMKDLLVEIIYLPHRIYNLMVLSHHLIYYTGEGTTVNAQLRTVSGTSAGGSEVPFIDQGMKM